MSNNPNNFFSGNTQGKMEVNSKAANKGITTARPPQIRNDKKPINAKPPMVVNKVILILFYFTFTFTFRR